MSLLQRIASFAKFRIATRDLIWAVVVVALVAAFYRPHLDDPTKTGRELDLRIRGPGYFIVEHETTRRRGFVRNGHLSLNQCGQVCAGKSSDTGSWIVQPQLTIPIDAVSIEISHDGIFSYAQNGSATKQQAGQLMLAKFINPDGLREIVDGVYEESNECGAANMATPGNIGLGFVEQGRLEKVADAKSTFDAVTFTCILCCGAALICVREVRLLRTTLSAKSFGVPSAGAREIASSAAG